MGADGNEKYHMLSDRVLPTGVVAMTQIFPRKKRKQSEPAQAHQRPREPPLSVSVPNRTPLDHMGTGDHATVRRLGEVSMLLNVHQIIEPNCTNSNVAVIESPSGQQQKQGQVLLRKILNEVVLMHEKLDLLKKATPVARTSSEIDVVAEKERKRTRKRKRKDTDQEEVLGDDGYDGLERKKKDKKKEKKNKKDKRRAKVVTERM